MSVTKTQVVVEASDGLPMATDVYTPAEGDQPLPATVVVHGFKGFKDWGFFPPLAERLAGRGRAVVVFNLSRNGIGDEPTEFTRLDLFEAQTYTRHLEDLGLVLDALESGPIADAVTLNTANRSLVGHSMGGSIAILCAAEDSRIGQIATLNGCARLDRFDDAAREELERTGKLTIVNARTGQEMPLGKAFFADLEEHDLQDAAESIFVPGLILQGEDDDNVTTDEGELLDEWMGTARYVTVPGDHTFGAVHPFAGWTPGLERVAEELDEFLPWVGRFGGTS